VRRKGMIKLEKKQQIIIKRQMGNSERAISRELGISRTTVRKYIKKYENKKTRAVRKRRKNRIRGINNRNS
jgi:DNA invertase Pin-like site-specific DNA recombinase